MPFFDNRLFKIYFIVLLFPIGIKLLWNIPQMFSMGFKTGIFDGHLRSWILTMPFNQRCTFLNVDRTIFFLKENFWFSCSTTDIADKLNSLYNIFLYPIKSNLLVIFRSFKTQLYPNSQPTLRSIRL